MCEVGNVVVFNELHKYEGRIGYISLVTENKILVAVPSVKFGVDYIYCDESDFINLNVKYPFEIR